MSQSYRTRVNFCPKCKWLIDGATDTRTTDGTSRPPGEGDVTVCVYCGSILSWGKNMKIKLATDEEIDQAGREHVMNVQTLILLKKFNRYGKPPVND